MKHTISQRLKGVRKNNRLTQLELAESLGVSQSYLAGVEREVKEVNTQTLRALKEKYNVSSDWLLFGEEFEISNNTLYSSFSESYNIFCWAVEPYINSIDIAIAELEKNEDDNNLSRLREDYKLFENWKSKAESAEDISKSVSNTLFRGTKLFERLDTADLTKHKEDIIKYNRFVYELFEEISQYTAKPLIKYMPKILIDSLRSNHGV